MTVKISEEVKTYLIFETASHKLKINEEDLEKLKVGKDATSKVATMVQKRMKQTISSVSGEMWEESMQEIFNKIMNIGKEEEGEENTE